MPTKSKKQKQGKTMEDVVNEKMQGLADALGSHKLTKQSQVAQQSGLDKDRDRAKDQAFAQYQSIVEMVAALNLAIENDDDNAFEDAEQTIHEDALSVEVRTDWHSVGAEDDKPTEYRILLCTGGPACQIIGNLSEHGEPETARIQYQDWFTPWTDYRLTSEQEEIVLTYARCFYFGE
jgi:hypothetical protein